MTRGSKASLVVPLDTGGIEMPGEFPNPFDEIGPHPLARRAAEVLQKELREHPLIPGDGKMLGVLVVRAPDGSVGFLRAFSGTIDGSFDVPGFVPPVFDREARAAVEVPGERVVTALTARAREYAASTEVAQLRETHQVMLDRHAREAAEMLERHRDQRASRRRLRAAADADAIHALAQESRADKAERRLLDERHAVNRALLHAPMRRLERRIAAHARLQRMVSRRLMRQIHDTYRIPNARGEDALLRDLFAPAVPPGGAADCAAPKLLAYASKHDLEPLALAELWWGRPPATGGRVEGAFYPSCKEKCGPLLPFMLEGLRVAPARKFEPPPAGALDLPVLHEDDWIVVVDKPAGLLSVPSRGDRHDNVVARLTLRYGEVLAVHRLDLDTSGVLVVARTRQAYAALQRQFIRRTVGKRYVAVVEGEPATERGVIELAIRVDPADRPRHIHDPVHGRRAITEWETTAKQGAARTRVALFPRTGRTHQLRVHAAHPLGLGTPIVGDRIYGHEGERLMLHAEHLELDHPATGERVRFESPAPF